MLFYKLVALLALVTVFIANYTDLKDRIIPNKLTFPMIASGVVLYLGYGIYRQDLIFAVKGGLGAGLTFSIGYGMWYVGGWAGGDVKLYTALGALLAGYSAPYEGAPYPFPITIFVNGIICIAPILIIYIIAKSIRTPEIGGKIVEPIRDSLSTLLVAPFVIIGGSILGSELAAFFGLSRIIQFILVIVFVFLIYRTPIKYRIPLALGANVYGVYLHSFLVLKFLAMAFAVLLGIRLIIVVIRVVNREVLQEEISMGELKEGMIPAETIYEKDDEVERYESPGVKEIARRIFSDPRNFQLKPDWDKVLADSSLAAGVSRYQVGVLRRHVREGRLEDHIRIKKGFPFAPSFALGVPIAIFYGDIYWWLVTVLGGG